MKKLPINELRDIVRATINEVHREMEQRAIDTLDVSNEIAALEALPQAQEIVDAVEHKLRTVLRIRSAYDDHKTAEGVLFRLIDSSIGTFRDEQIALEELGVDTFPEQFAKVMATLLADNFV